MKKVIVALALVFFFALLSGQSPAKAYTNACWGQASAAFAQLGEMGEHASQQAEPRYGLGVLANMFYEDGIIDAPTLQALGAFLVSIDPDLTIDACMD